MSTFTETINFLGALGTLTIAGIAVIALITHVVHRKRAHALLDKVSAWMMWIGLAVSIMAIVGSLIYSGIIGYEPCVLCWWQRVLIYPQVILYAIALFKQDRGVFKYALALSLIGIVFALYHNFINFGGSEFISCGTGTSCTTRYVYEFGFVTIPLMSLFSLITLAITGWIGLERNNK
jgi:disulfide bond formation protein DsbB